MRVFLSIIIAILLITGCKNDKNIPDVSNIKMDVDIKRFDKDFFAIDTNHLAATLGSVRNKYPSFLPIYFEYFSPIDFMIREQGKSYEQAITEYYRNMKSLFDSVQLRFPTISSVKNDLQQQLRYVKHYFPDFNAPAVLTSVESLNPENPLEIYGTTFYHDSLIISLQMFMGKDFQVYDPEQYPEYLRRRFEKQYIVPNCIRAICADIYPDSSEGAPMIEQMIEKGKQWYMMNKFMPGSPDTLITGYTGRQAEWCRNNEGQVWAYINQNENLYTIEQTTVQGYIGEAPFTQTLPHGNSGEGAPGNIGQWIGWRIIQAYAEKNPHLSIHNILLNPAKKIFEGAKYKPK
jgi:hypothetical protein